MTKLLEFLLKQLGLQRQSLKRAHSMCVSRGSQPVDLSHREKIDDGYGVILLIEDKSKIPPNFHYEQFTMFARADIQA